MAMIDDSATLRNSMDDDELAAALQSIVVQTGRESGFFKDESAGYQQDDVSDEGITLDAWSLPDPAL